ncbi:MAG TPA: heavy metal-binding domain-containing protein, partial [Sphingomicrobium sp.]|nr:heavy metal-binding domain-containing protein [Sphingomicrobium sp.]
MTSRGTDEHSACAKHAHHAHLQSPVGSEDVPPGTIWTCPMHPQIRRNGPGQCPICGMALEPLEPTLDESPNPELVDMTKRFWVSAALSVPLVALAMGMELLGWRFMSMRTAMWVQLA